ncbi:unnamed protein product [Cyprideis torosa]|uniref:Uncharacterized protein n=1 Tax=Cyprideis torosa TaxID=163714 RepID=A0A7R8WDD6_9CRUS|nr:unnamed protein product [Cyprideis torosa]CAG0889403.1 unnamed protein product [Cyprideis torosa]
MVQYPGDPCITLNDSSLEPVRTKPYIYAHNTDYSGIIGAKPVPPSPQFQFPESTGRLRADHFAPLHAVWTPGGSTRAIEPEDYSTRGLSEPGRLSCAGGKIQIRIDERKDSLHGSTYAISCTRNRVTCDAALMLKMVVKQWLGDVIGGPGGQIVLWGPPLLWDLPPPTELQLQENRMDFEQTEQSKPSMPLISNPEARK